jgi:polysaccharide export outer membrane protein
MSGRYANRLPAALWVALAIGAACAGCDTHKPFIVPCGDHLPRELNKVSLPDYVIEPPDLLLIDALRVVPLPPYHIEPQDVLVIRATPPPRPMEPIEGQYVVEPEGTVNLGFSYGTVSVADLTTDEAAAAIKKYLEKTFTEVSVTVALAQSRARQQIRGEHLVSQDGTVSLGLYGRVGVAGRTRQQAREAIETHLAQFLYKPEVSVDVAAYNSKVYYVITDGAGLGRQIYRFPILGNETVLDGLSQIQGVPPVAAHNRVWVARPAPAETCAVQVLPVDLIGITEKGVTATNYQLLPGDRVFVQADRLITLDNTFAKITTPLERLFGVTLLGSSVFKSLGWTTFQNGNGTGGFGGFGGF